MGNKFRKLTIAVLLTGAAAVLVASPAQANRGEPGPTTTTTTQPSYVPPPKYGQNPHPVLPEEQDPYAPAPPAVVRVVLPQLPADAPVVSPGAGGAGDNSGRGDAPGDKVLGENQERAAAPTDGGGFIGGVLTRTGANTLPLVRAGLGALTLGAGLLILARRRKAGA